jgi:hypothetical protein
VTLRAFALFAGASLLLTAGGCSTVLVPEKSLSENVAERAALVEAAAAVAETRWPKPEAASWSDRLAGDATKSDVSESDAARIYAASLETPRKAALLEDASRHIAAGRDLVGVAAAAAEAIRPAMSDVSVVEAAIADLRQARDIYLASLKLIGREGEPVASSESRELKSEFAAVIEDLGAAADARAPLHFAPHSDVPREFKHSAGEIGSRYVLKARRRRFWAGGL